MIVHVINGSTTTGISVVNLTTDANGIARGVQNSDLEFWYLRDTAYNFTLEFFGSKNWNYNVTYSDQWTAGDWRQVYNYTLYQGTSLDFTLQLNQNNYLTKFNETYGYYCELGGKCNL